jgi:hypothetical protein
MSQQRTYIDGIYVREKSGNYGPFFSVGIDVEKLVAQAKQHGDGKFLNVTISARKQPSDKGITHSVSLDTYRKENAGKQFDKARAAAGQPSRFSDVPNPPAADDQSDIPF